MDQHRTQNEKKPFVLLSSGQICQVLGISRRTLRCWIQKKQFPQPLRIGPQHVAYPSS